MSERRTILVMEDFDSVLIPVSETFAGCGCARCRDDTTLPLCRADARAQGYSAGRDERGAADAAQAEMLAAVLLNALRGADAAANDLAEASADALGRVVIAMAAATLPATFAALGAREVRAIAAAVLPALKTEPAIMIRAAPDALHALHAIPDHTPEPMRSRLTLLADDTAPPGEVQIIWHAGATRCAPSEALARVMTVLAEFGLVPPPGGYQENILTEPTEALAHG